VPIPTEVQVRVHAAGVNPVDFKTRAGKGMAGVLGSPPVCLGWDVSGVVTAVGVGVTRFKFGEEVFGMPGSRVRPLAYSEYVTAPSRHFAASHTPIARGSRRSALAGLPPADHRRHDPARGRRRPPDPRRRRRGRHLAVQVAKARGANVIGTARAEQADWLRELGAEQVVDYKSERFEDLVADLDAVIDLPGSYGERSLAVLRPGGMFVSVPSGVPQEVLDLAARSRRRGHRLPGRARPGRPRRPLAPGRERARLQVKVDQVFDLEDAAEAHRLAEAGHAGARSSSAWLSRPCLSATAIG